MTRPFDAAGVLERLQALDAAVASTWNGTRTFELVIAGGGAISVQGLVNPRYTTDIDLLQVPDGFYHLLDVLDMNADMNTFYYDCPTHWHDRIQPVPGFQGEAIDAYTLGPEDLAITKLIAWRPQDREDLATMWTNGAIDHGTLDALLADPLEVAVNLDAAQWEALNQHVAILDGNGDGHDPAGPTPEPPQPDITPNGPWEGIQ